jgi:hypothetical protein
VFLKNKKETMYFFKIIKKKILILPNLLHYQHSRKFKRPDVPKKYKGKKKKH